MLDKTQGGLKLTSCFLQYVQKICW